MQDTITQISLDQLHPSPFNYRKRMDETGLRELAADIKAQGRVLQPLLVRPRVPALFKGDPDAQCGFEVVFGHRRHQGATLAGLSHAPCMVREMSDEEAKRAQISENLQREDVHPIEEAEGFQALIDEHNMTADLIAEQHGKSRSYVYGRLKLLEACPTIRKACLEGTIGSEVALLVARLRTPKLQEKALGYIERDYRANLEDGGQASFRSIRSMLNEKFALDLKGAIFDIEDEMLVPLAGHCVRCPKRSGNAPEYEDVASPDLAKGKYGQRKDKVAHEGADVCTDPDCFDEKKKAHLKREAAKLEAAGKTVIQGAKARTLVDAQGKLKDAYIPLKDVKAEIKKLPKHTLSGAEVKIDVVTIQNPRNGKTIEVVKATDLKASGVKVKEPKAEDMSWEQRNAKALVARKNAEEKAEQLTALNLQVLDQTLAAMAAQPRTTLELYWMAEKVFEGTDWDVRSMLAKRHGFERSDDLEKVLGQWPADRLALFAVECVLLSDAVVETHTLLNIKKGEASELLVASAKHYGVDVAGIRAGSQGPETKAPTPSSAARAKKVKAAAGAKKGKAKASPPVDEQEPGDEVKDDAGDAGGSDAGAEALEDAGA